MNCEVFISYKCSDENGSKTPDYQMGSELYNALSNIGYNVFFSSDTLEKLGSSRYKMDIDSALDTAKITEQKTIVCGHYPTRYSDIYHGNGFIAIDAGIGTNKKVNVFVIDDGIKCI